MECRREDRQWWSRMRTGILARDSVRWAPPPDTQTPGNRWLGSELEPGNGGDGLNWIMMKNEEDELRWKTNKHLMEMDLKKNMYLTISRFCEDVEHIDAKGWFYVRPQYILLPKKYAIFWKTLQKIWFYGHCPLPRSPIPLRSWKNAFSSGDTWWTHKREKCRREKYWASNLIPERWVRIGSTATPVVARSIRNVCIEKLNLRGAEDYVHVDTCEGFTNALLYKSVDNRLKLRIVFQKNLLLTKTYWRTKSSDQLCSGRIIGDFISKKPSTSSPHNAFVFVRKILDLSRSLSINPPCKGAVRPLVWNA